MSKTTITVTLPDGSSMTREVDSTGSLYDYRILPREFLIELATRAQLAGEPKLLSFSVEPRSEYDESTPPNVFTRRTAIELSLGSRVGTHIEYLGPRTSFPTVVTIDYR